MWMARRARPNASDQKALEECADSNPLDCQDKLVDLTIGDHERRRHFQHHEVIAADLRENAVVSKQAHHDDLPEHRRMDGHECFKRNAQPE